MNEAILERLDKEEDDRQWEELHGKPGRAQEPSPQQRSYLSFLAKEAGMQLDVSKILDRAQASRLIEKLKRLRSMRKPNIAEDRDRRIAFGMATKLVYRKYIDLHHSPGGKRFWNEVRKLFSDFEEHLGMALGDVGADAPQPLLRSARMNGRGVQNGE